MHVDVALAYELGGYLSEGGRAPLIFRPDALLTYMYIYTSSSPKCIKALHPVSPPTLYAFSVLDPIKRCGLSLLHHTR